MSKSKDEEEEVAEEEEEEEDRHRRNSFPDLDDDDDDFLPPIDPQRLIAPLSFLRFLVYLSTALFSTFHPLFVCLSQA